MFEKLKEIENTCKNCTKCPLSQSRKNVVFSGGIPNSKIMLIGEAPGADEDEQGQPFVGRSGQLLTKILESVGFKREENIYICNTIKCRPPQNRNPTTEEEELCGEYLKAQIDILQPKIILLCGAVATNTIMKQKLSITKVRGQWFDGPHGAKMMPIFHPAYLLRNPTREVGGPKWLMYQDMKKIKEYYDKL